MDKISIIVPVYNAEKYLKQCIDSLLKQTYENIEVILINDCSQDNSLAILEQYKSQDNRIIVINNEENLGAGGSRNRGLNIATGKYIMFCDNDDEYLPNMCQILLDTLITQNVDIAACSPKILYETEYSHNKDIINYISQIPIGKHFINENNIINFNVVLWNKIFKKDIINKFNIRFPQKISHEDDAFVFEYLIACKNYYGIDKELYKYIVRESSCMATSYGLNTPEAKKYDRIHIASCIYQFIQTNDIYEVNKNILNTILTAEFKSHINDTQNKSNKGTEEIIKNLIEQNKLPTFALKLYGENSNFIKKHKNKQKSLIQKLINKLRNKN